MKSGDLLLVGREASPQFLNPIMFRVIRVVEEWTKTTYDGWIWLDGYQLDAKGDAIARRSIFVQPAGLRRLAEAPQPRRAPRATSSRPADHVGTCG